MELTKYKILLAFMLLYMALFLLIAVAFAEPKDPAELLIGNELRDIAMDEDYVWIATEKGVNQYDRKTDEWKFFTVADGLSSNQVNCIEPERVEGILTKKSGDEVWFGTESGVCVYYKLTKEWKTYTTKDGLIYNRINDISARGNDVWVATDKGVSVLDKKKGTWMSYSRFPGIPTSEVTTIYHEYAYAWVGTQQGLARYNYKHKKWEYFKLRGSLWYSPEGGTRTASDSPLTDERINSIDGEGRYIYIATKSALMEFDESVATSYLTERNAYMKLGRPNRAAANAMYRSRWLEPGVRLAMARDRKDAWEENGWKSMDISSLMGDKKYEVSDNFLDVKYRSQKVWVATNRGLVSFDSWLGERQIFTKENGLIDDEVKTVALGGNDVWVGTAHGLGTYSVLSRSWKNYQMEKALPSSYVTALAEDKDAMWFATRGAASSLNNQTERWKTYTRDEGLAGANISSIAVVGNYVWFGTDEGVSRLNKSTKAWDNFNAIRSGLVSNDITAILVDGKYIWVGTKLGLNRYDDTTGQWETYSTSFGLLDNGINALAADPQYVWVGTKSGLNRYDKASEKWSGYTTADGLSNNVITSLALDSEHVWAATRRGLNVMDRETEKWTVHTDEAIYAITVEDSGKVWMAGRGYINRLDPATGEIKKFTDEDADGISRVIVYGAQDTEQYVWFATNGGIFRYKKSDGSWWVYSPTKQRGSTDTLVDANIQAIVGDKDFIYFGTAAGISRYDKVTGNWLSYTVADGLVDENVRALLMDGPDLWIGTQNGISGYDTVSDIWTNYTRKDGLPSDDVYSLTLENRNIWAGTHGGAAFMEKNGSNWKKITMADGLPDDHVWSVAIDSPHIWFGTNNGAARYDPAENLWITYKVDDGLINNAVFSIGFEDKYVFLNTPGGTSIYDKELDLFTPFSQSDGLAGQTARSIGSAQTGTQSQDHLKQEVWIGTFGGATRYDMVSDTASSMTRDDGLAGDKVQAIRIDGKYIWFGTDSGVSRYDSLTDEWLNFGEAAISSDDEQASGLISYNIKSLANDDNYLWVGTRTGLSRYDKVSNTWKYLPLDQTRLRTLAVAEVETQTFAESAAGFIGNLGPQKKQGTMQKSQIPRTNRPSIRAIALGGNYLWLGADVGIYMYDKSLNELKWFTSEVKNVRDIRIYKGDVWVIAEDRIAIFERGGAYDSWTIISDTQVEEEVTSDKAGFQSRERDLTSGSGLVNLTSAVINDKLVWLGREKGLRIYNADKREPDRSIRLPDDISEKKITAMALDTNPGKDSAEYLWIGSREGLYKYNLKAGLWEFYTSDNGLASNYISCLAVDDGYVWVGSSNRGVSRYDKSNGEWEIFDRNHGLADENVRAIAVDDKYIWFGTFSGGVCRYDKTSELWTTYRSEKYTGRTQS